MLKAFKDYPYSHDALSYAYDVVKRHRAASKEIIQACQRFIDDLTRDFKYTYDVDLAEKACAFIEKLPHTKGKWAARKETLVLEGWQRFIVCNLFGWVNEAGLRRFRKAYLKVTRKNGEVPDGSSDRPLYVYEGWGNTGQKFTRVLPRKSRHGKSSVPRD